MNILGSEITSYESLKYRLSEYASHLELCDRFHNIGGIPYSLVTKFNEPHIKSGYSMGEVIIIRCNGEFIHRIDNTEEYAKSCKWQAKHGRIILDFTKKDLRKFFDICAKENNRVLTEEEAKLKKELILKSVNKLETKTKSNKIILL